MPIAAAFLLFVAVARAAGADEPEDVTVHGPRSAGFVSTAKEREDPREITDAASLIEPMPGVHVRRLGADDGFASLSIRGTSSSQVNIMLAGVPLSGGSDPSVDLSTLPLWPGARARVFRSFSPAAMGQGSLGGTLTLDPPSAYDRERTEVYSAVGSFGAARLRAGDVRDLGDGARIVTGLSASRADDDYDYYNIAHNAPTLDPRQFVTRENAQHADASALVGLALPFRHGSLRMVAMLQAREQHLPGTIFVLTPHQRLAMNRQLMGIEASFSSGTYARLWARREGRTLTDAPSTGSLDPTLADSSIVASGTAAGWRGMALKTLRFEGVVDARAERFAPGAYIGPTPPDGATRVAVGAGADADWRPVPAFSLSASGRVDGWHDDAAMGASSDIRPTAHAGAELALGPVVLDAHGGALARPPNFAERFGSSGGSLPTPDLRTESAWTVDAGARVSGKKGPFTGSLELAGFATWASDLITFVLVSARSVPKAENIGDARVLGLEATAQARLYGARLRATYTGLATTNISACVRNLQGDQQCPPLPGRPEHDVTVDLSYTLGPVTVRYGLDALAGIHADDAGTIEVPARVLQSAGARLAVDPRVTLAVDVRNLADVRTGDYAQSFNGSTVPYPIGDAFYYPLPGRSVLASVRISTP